MYIAIYTACKDIYIYTYTLRPFLEFLGEGRVMGIYKSATDKEYIAYFQK